jgi:hypothetical protein
VHSPERPVPRRTWASTVFARLLKRKRGFSWAADGEELLRRSKPRYFEREQIPRTVPLSRLLSDALQRDRRGSQGNFHNVPGVPPGCTSRALAGSAGTGSTRSNQESVTQRA